MQKVKHWIEQKNGKYSVMYVTTCLQKAESQKQITLAGQQFFKTMQDIFDNIDNAFQVFDQQTKAMKTPYKVLYGRVYNTKEEYDQAIHDFLNEN